jgi:hypothetical protein
MGHDFRIVASTEGGILMAKFTTTIVEIPGRTAPADLANTLAVIGWFPALASIVYAQRFSDVATLGIWGKPADLGAAALREADDAGNPSTVYFVPAPATVVGTIVDNGATGFGPTQTMAAASHGHPYDDAVVKVRVQDSGIPGVATFELSTSYLVTRDVNGGNPSIEPLYLPAQNIPAETSAYATGSVNLANIVYAKPAIVTGTINIVNSTTLFGSGGTLAGKNFDINPDAGGVVTVTFGTGLNAPSSYVSVVNTFNTALTGDASAAVTNEGKLRLTGVLLSSAGSLALIAGTPDALPLLGLSVASTPGTAGALDGLTVIYQGDATGGSQTWTIPTAGSAYSSSAALLSAADGFTGVSASSYSAANFLRIGSETLGSLSTFQITGGTGRVALGLSLGTFAGAASEYVIEHLGVKITFPQGTYTSGYTRTWTVKAPLCTIADVQTSIDAMVAQGIHVGRVLCPSNVPIGQVAGFIQGAASKIGTLYAANDAHFLHFAFGAPIDEADADVKAAYVSGVAGDKNVGLRVDLAVRKEYFRPARSTPNGTGALLRSPLWSLAGRYAAMPLGSDVGQHNNGALPYVDYAPVDEDAATVKLSASRVDTADPRAMALQQWADGLYFNAGYTLAPSASAYADQYVRDITLRVAQLVHSALIPLLNVPTLATDPTTGKLTDKGAGTVAAIGLSALSSILASDGASEEELSTKLLTFAVVVADRNEIIAETQRVKVDVTFGVRGIAREIRLSLGAGRFTITE